MTCRELAEFLMAYLDGELPDAQRAVFEQHLAGCPECRLYLDSYRTTIALGRDALQTPEADRAAPPPADLVTAILASRRGEPPTA